MFAGGAAAVTLAAAAKPPNGKGGAPDPAPDLLSPVSRLLCQKDGVCVFFLNPDSRSTVLLYPAFADFYPHIRSYLILGKFKIPSTSIGLIYLGSKTSTRTFTKTAGLFPMHVPSFFNFILLICLMNN